MHLGKPEAARFTLPKNPFAPVTAIVDVLELPCTIFRDAGEAANVKLDALVIEKLCVTGVAAA